MNANPNHSSSAWLYPIWEVLKLCLVPTLILGACVGSIAILGLAQRSGWLMSASSDGESNRNFEIDLNDMIGETSEETSATSYICPMMCVPPTTKPGRCPVCAMELVPAAGVSDGPSTKIQIDPRSRRVAGIQTVAAKTETLFREVRGVGEISYDESKLKTLSAYIDGRIEELYADYTGIEVKQGDSLALIYSPDLYAAQVSYSRTLEFAENASGENSRTADANQRLLDSSRQKLIELGMTEEQIKTLERDKKPNSRLALHAPMSGTVIEKMVVAGQYVKTGAPVYKLADLSSVWLVMELFPEDARVIQIGQKVIATTQSMHGTTCEGIVEFVEPTVDPKMRTVGIRVVINNEQGHLRPGEFIRATLKIPHLSKNGVAQETVVVPRNSLLSIGQTSIVYVEGKPGEFELRRVKTGPAVDGQIAIFEGLAAGENVVARSTFLLDAQMQLQGNPSLMDPDKAGALAGKDMKLSDAEIEEVYAALEPLSQSDRQLAEAQVICPVTKVRLGSMGMGTPIKLEIEGKTVFICCEGCRDGWVNAPEKYFTILDDYLSGRPTSSMPKMPTVNDSTKDDRQLPQMELPQMELPQMELPK
jgi:Cu(I)/Ag(I) efflux system membrane fusion protein